MKALDVLEVITKYERTNNQKNLLSLAETFITYRSKEIKIYDNSSLGTYLKKNRKELEDLGYKYKKTPNFFRNYYIISVQ